MKSVVVGVSDCRFSDHPETTLITYALGSCIAVSIHDPALKVGGLLHYMLPESSLHGDRAGRNPFMFADSGIQSMLRTLTQKGVNPRRSVVNLAGGASVMNGIDIPAKRWVGACREPSGSTWRRESSLSGKRAAATSS
jgi:chemotaxis protein CheD